MNPQLQKIIDPGQLREVIEVKRLIEVKDEYAGVTPSLLSFAIIRAAVDYETGKESETADKETVRQKVVFTVRYLDIKNTDTVEYDGKLYDIEYLETYGPKRFLKIITQLRE